MNTENQVMILGDVSFLRFLSKEESLELLESGKKVEFKENDLIFSEGDEGDAMYLILSGKVEIFKQNKKIAQRGVGEVFGEMAMIEAKPRSAGVRALMDTVLFEIGRPVFERRLASHPEVIKAFLHTISDRCRVDLDIIDAGYLELYKSEERYRTIVETISDIVLQIDPEGKIIFTNSAVNVLGYKPADLLGKPFTVLMKSSSTDFPIENLLTKRVGARATSNVEVIFLVNEGSTVFEFMHEIPFLVDAHGIWNVRNELVLKKDSPKEFLGTLCIARDFSERKKAEVQLKERKEELESLVQERTKFLEEAKKEAEQANLAKSDFLSRVSHELRTPLNAILGFGELLKTSPAVSLPKDEATYLEHVNSAGEHLLCLISEIMDLSRIESNNIELESKEIDLCLLIKDLIQYVMPQVQSSGITLHHDLEQNPSFIINADATRVRQVMLNLLTNAIKYNKKNGEIHINLRHPSNETVEISVSDTGIGISEENKAKVFEPFQRLSQEFSEIEGTGIGLTISKRLVELMDGSMKFTSTLNQGSCFTVTLPLEGKALALKGEENDSEAGAGEESEGKLRILYVEDNIVNLKLFKAIIARFSNVELLSEMTAEKGIQCAVEKKPDLILMDIQLPKMDGYEALEILKRTPETKGIPVIALSALAMHGEVEKGLKAGFDDYLTKPINIKKLSDLVSRYIDMKNGARNSTS